MKILLKNIRHLITMNDKMEVKENVDMLLESPKILKIDKNIEEKADEIIDASNMIILPGFINTHHHFYQTFTRVYPPVQNSTLFTWLVNLYEIWKYLDEEEIYYSAKLAIMELLRTGCTTTTDHLYIYPKGFSKSPIEYEIKAAKELGIRFVPTHGNMSRSKKDGGLPPDSLVREEEKILEDSVYLIEKYHNPESYSMLQIALAPCSPFSTTKELMKETARLARKYKVLLHTHLCETLDEEKYCLEVYGKRPLALMEEVEWLGDDVWYAHGIYFNDDELKILAETKTNICHCPTSNMRLGSGICRVCEMKEMGINVGLGVDGSASNDSSDMWGEVRNAFLLQRIKYGTEKFTALDALSLATKNGAKLLKRNELGIIEEGKAADIIGIKVNKLDFIGSAFDYTAAVVFCGSSHYVDLNIVNGKIIILDGKFTNIDEEMEKEKIIKIWEKYKKKSIGNV